MNWTNDELEAIAAADELQLSSLRQDDTLRNPVTIWVVRVGDNLYVRSVKGRSGPWFVGTLSTRKGHIATGGVEKDVEFVDVDEDVASEVDAAYTSKYHSYASNIVEHVLTPQAIEATIKLVPR